MAIRYLLIACGAALSFVSGGYHQIDLSTVAVFEHKDRPFTQGLAVTEQPECLNQTESFLDECLQTTKDTQRAQCYVKVLRRCIVLYESAGLYHKSFVQRIDNFDTGHPTKRLSLANTIFAEGLTVMGNGDLLLGTWHEHRLLRLQVDEKKDFHTVEEIVILEPSEMWGVASDGNSTVWMTSGTSLLYEFDVHELGKGNLGPYTNIEAFHPEVKTMSVLSPQRKVHIHDDRKMIRRVNELEYHKGRGTLWGNIWMKDTIVEFDPKTGVVVGTLDLKQHSPLAASLGGRRSLDDVWNGIAFIGNSWMIFTGKRFPYVYVGKLKLAPR